MHMTKKEELVGSLGFINFYGNSPAMDLLKDPELKERKSIKVFLNGASDIRHALKTISDNCHDFGAIENLDFYIYEGDAENIARAILFTEIFNNSKMSYRERIELFYDFYWNNFIRKRSVEYLDERIKHLEDVVCDQERCALGIKSLWNFKNYKFKDRDKLIDIFRRWYSKIPFDMEKYRDDRLRYLFRERYDFRKNLYDWDYVWGLKELAPIIHPREYKQWRHNGVAFEIRTASYVYPNRTMSSFVDGNRKRTRDSCIVLGFWGDIVLGPFVTMGIETDSEPENEKLFRKRNHHHLHISQHIAEFNCYAMVYKMEKLEDYHLDWDGEDAKKKKEAMENYEKKKNLEEIKEDVDEEEETEEGKTIKEIEKNRPQENGRQNLITIEKEEIEEEETTLFLFGDLIPGLKNIDINFYPVSLPVEKIVNKKKYQNLFDIVCNGFKKSLDIRNENMIKILAPGAIVYQENTHFLVPVKMEQRKESNINMLKETIKSLTPVDSGIPSQFKFIAQKN